jgi:hypothetical protein
LSKLKGKNFNKKSKLTLNFLSSRPRSALLGNIPNTEIYESVEVFEQAQEFENIKIIRYEESLYYANVDNFKYQIIKLSGVNPEDVSRLIKKEEEKEKKIVRFSIQILYFQFKIYMVYRLIKTKNEKMHQNLMMHLMERTS